MYISIPYGRTHLTAELPEERVQAVLKSHLESYVPPMGQTELVEAALHSPIGSETLEKLAEGKQNIVLIASDHTRPVPSKVLVPPMLKAIRRGNPNAKITILIATGCHRGTTKAELVEKFGPEIVEREKIVIHDCAAEADMVTIGTLPSGGTLRINRRVSSPASPPEKRYTGITMRNLLHPPLPVPAFWRAIPFTGICSMQPVRQSWPLSATWSSMLNTGLWALLPVTVNRPMWRARSF